MIVTTPLILPRSGLGFRFLPLEIVFLATWSFEVQKWQKNAFMVKTQTENEMVCSKPLHFYMTGAGAAFTVKMAKII